MSAWRLAAAGALLLAACNRGGRKPGVPADTALRIPLDTGIRPGDTGVVAMDTTARPADSLPPAPSVVLLADSAAGDALYHGKARCFTCHGNRAEGTSRLGPALTDSVWVDGDGSLAAIRAAIAGGVAVPRASSVAMPAYAGTLTPAEIARVAAYVYTLSHPGAAVADTTHADSAIAGAPGRVDSAATGASGTSGTSPASGSSGTIGAAGAARRDSIHAGGAP